MRYNFISLQPLKWELKQKPGMSPPRGGFRPDDPNQQIVGEDIFDEYGGKPYLETESQQIKMNKNCYKLNGLKTI